MDSTTTTGYLNYSFDEEISRRGEGTLSSNTTSQVVEQWDGVIIKSVPQPAVVVRNAYKSYQSHRGAVNVLSDFNMTVPQSTIYSLLGSSGCGKTTILSCCVGLKDLDRGEISIFGAKPGSKKCGVPGRLGYMPQDTALYMELTIKESLEYFGRMFGMSIQAIEKSIEFLITFLALPPPHRRISTLSGGQKRRVSFAIALVHSPKLMILDEPTVGVDPLLRQSIWNHLLKIVSSGRTTVIITTHYIEEAKQSHQIGLMRGGRILSESSPASLLQLYNTNLLEDIVLKLCLEDNFHEDGESITSSSSTSAAKVSHKRIIKNSETNITHSMSPPENKTFSETVAGIHTSKVIINPQLQDKLDRNPIHFHKLSNPVSKTTTKNNFNGKAKEIGVKSGQVRSGGLLNSFSRISAMAYKNIIVLLRNIPFLLFMVFVPASQVIIICIAIGKDPQGLKFGLVNLDVENPSDCYSGTGCVSSNNYTGSLSCRYLDILERHRTLEMIIYDTEEEAAEDVEKSVTWGYLLFQKNYTVSMKDRAVFGMHAELETIHGSRIKFRVDQSNLQIYREVAKVFYQSFGEYMKNVAQDCDIDPIFVELPFYFDKPIFGKDSVTFTDFLAPSIFLAVMFFFPLCGSGISYITEKKSGTLARILVAGMTSFEVMLAYLVVQLVILFIQAGLAFIIMNLVFKIQIVGPIVLAIVLAILVGIAGMSMGFLLATICSEEIQAILIALGTFIPHLLLSGMMWPLQGMHVYLQYFSHLLPCTFAAESMRSILTRGVGFTHSTVWPGFLSIIMWIIVYWLLTIFLHKLSSKK